MPIDRRTPTGGATGTPRESRTPQIPQGRGRVVDPSDTFIERFPTYIEKKDPTGKSYWINPKRPDEGYLVDPSKNKGAIAYPIEYINWILRNGPPSAGSVRRSASGKQAREIGGQALKGKIGVAYGQVRIAPSVFFGPRNVIGLSSSVVVGYGLSQGPCDSLVDTIFPHGKTVTEMRACGGAGGSAAYQDTFYPGVLSPGAASARFMSTVAGADPATFERYPGLCYVDALLLWYESCWSGIPGAYPLPLFVLKGRLVRNYQTLVDEWSDNPASCTADYITSRQYGRAAKVNASSVADAAAYCNETFLNTATGLNEKKHQMDLYLLRAANHQSHIDAMRAHFRCSIIERYGEFVFLIDKDRAAVASFNEAEAVPITVERLGGSGTPNTVSVSGPDPNKEWEHIPEYARTSGAEAGLVLPIDADYELEGLTRSVHRASEAYYLLNTRLNNLRVVLRAVHPKARKLEPNDVIEYTSASFGLTGFKLRVLRVTRDASGTSWMVECAGHNAGIYNFQARAIETYPLPVLPSPYEVPAAPSGFSATEELYQRPDGTYGSRIRVDWTRDTGTTAGDTEITYQRAGGAEASLGVFPGDGPAYLEVSDDLAEYTFRGYTLNVNIKSIRSAAASDAVTAVGKTTPPERPVLATAAQIGRRVEVRWQPPADRTIVGYEVRYGKTGGATQPWADMTRIARADIKEVFHDPPAGTWRYGVASVDYAGRVSDPVFTYDVTVFTEGTDGADETSVPWYHQLVPTIVGPYYHGDTVLLSWPYGTPSVAGDPNTALYGLYLEGYITGKVKIYMYAGGVENGNVLLGGTYYQNIAFVDAVMAANGWTNLDEYEANYAVPRRGGQGLWAPLRLYDTNGVYNEIGGVSYYAPQGRILSGTGLRNTEWKFRALNGTRIGDSEAVVTAGAIQFAGNYSRQSPVELPSAAGVGVQLGIAIGTNSPFAQEYFEADASGNFFAYRYVTKPVLLGTFDVTSATGVGGGGMATWAIAAINIPAAKVLPSGAVPTITEMIVINGMTAFLDVITLSNSTVWIRTRDAAGADLAGVNLRVTLYDTGRGGTITETFA